MRRVAILLAGVLAVAGCGERVAAPAPVPASAAAPAAVNAVVAYLDGAEMQAETDAQRLELRRALADLAVRSAPELRAARYAGPSGQPGERDLVQVLRAHLVPATPTPLDADRLFEDAARAEARAALRERIAEIDRSLGAASAPGR